MIAQQIIDSQSTKNALKIALYVRVSTQEQAKEGYSIGEQVERLNKYCEAMGWTVVETFIDPGYSGGDTERPGLKAMLKSVENGNIDKVVVYKLDRLSRSQKDTLFLIEDVFLKNNTDFVSMNENFDTSTPFGRAMIGILAVFAQLEREQIKERMNMGKEARAKEGKWGGGSTEPIGYNYDIPNDLLIVNDYEALQVRELFDLFNSGMPLRTIERLFADKGYKHKHGIWDPKAMKRVLSSKAYLGYIKYRGEYYKAEHDAIITEETYNKAIQLLKQRAEQYQMTGLKPGLPTTYLGGLLYCKHCGGKYAKDRQRMRGDKPDKLMYICNSRSKRVKKMIKDPNCKNKRWGMNALDNIVLDEIKKLATDPEYFNMIQTEKPKTDEPNKIDIIEKEIEKIDAQISRFMDLYGVGTFTMDQVNNKVAPLNEQRRGLEKELAALNAEVGRITEEEMKAIVASAEDTIAYGDFDDVRGMIESLIYYIELDNDDVYIHWKFA